MRVAMIEVGGNSWNSPQIMFTIILVIAHLIVFTISTSHPDRHQLSPLEDFPKNSQEHLNDPRHQHHQSRPQRQNEKHLSHQQLKQQQERKSHNHHHKQLEKPHHSHNQRQQQEQEKQHHNYNHHQQQQQQQKRRRRRHHHGDDDDSCSPVKSYFGNLHQGLEMHIEKKKVTVSEESICSTNDEVLSYPHHRHGNHHSNNNSNNNNNNNSNNNNYNKTCCSLHSEQHFQPVSLEKLLADLHFINNELRNGLETTLDDYKEYFVYLLSAMRDTTAQLLTDRVGLPKDHVDRVVGQLVGTFQDHLFGEDGNMKEAMEHFMGSLFSLSYYYIVHDFDSPQGTPDPDPSHRNCTAQVHRKLSGYPFGEKMNLFTFSVYKPFGYVKMLLSFLNVAHEALTMTDSLKLDDKCSRALVRMNFCPKCFGFTSVRPCLNYCKNVITGCLALQQRFNIEWKTLTQTVTQLINNKKADLNFELFVEIFPEKIEQAFVHFLSQAEYLHAKVGDICGNLSSSPSSSSPSSSSSSSSSNKWTVKNFEKLREKAKILNETSFGGGQGHKEVFPPATRTVADLEVFVLNFCHSPWMYSKMTGEICNSIGHVPPGPGPKGSGGMTHDFESVPAHHEHHSTTTPHPFVLSQCWNGSAIGEYTKPFVPSFSQRQRDLLPKDQMVETITERIESMTAKLYSKLMAPFDNFHYGSGFGGGGLSSGYFESGDDELDSEDEFSGFFSGYNSGDGTIVEEETNKTIMEKPLEKPSPGGDFDFSDPTLTPLPSSSSTTKTTITTITTTTSKPTTTSTTTTTTSTATTTTTTITTLPMKPSAATTPSSQLSVLLLTSCVATVILGGKFSFCGLGGCLHFLYFILIVKNLINAKFFAEVCLYLWNFCELKCVFGATTAHVFYDSIFRSMEFICGKKWI